MTKSAFIFLLIITLSLSIFLIEPFYNYENAAFAEEAFFHVTLYSDGEVYLMRTKLVGTTCPIPDFDSSRAPLGKTFSYWSTSESGVSFDFSTDVSYQELVLYAVFIDKEYSVKLYENGEVKTTFTFAHGTIINQADLSQDDTIYIDANCTLVKEFPFEITEDLSLFTKAVVESPLKPLRPSIIKPLIPSLLKPIKPSFNTPSVDNSQVENSTENNVTNGNSSDVDTNDNTTINQENRQPNDCVWLPSIGITIGFVSAILLYYFTCFQPKKQVRK